LGKTAKPLDIQRFVKEQFGLDMTTDHISATKTKLRHEGPKGKAAGKAQPAAKKKLAKKQTAPKIQRQAAAKPGTGAGTISVQDVATVQELVRRVGRGELRSLIDLLAR
jgi:hypothetical protein